MLRTAALGSVLALALAAGASASLVAALDMRQLVERADRVAVVQVVAQATQQDDRSRIVTDVTLEVLEPLAGGAASGERFTLVRLGGAVGDVGMRVEGEPGFQDGARYLVFARRWRGEGAAALYRPVGMSQGVMRVQQQNGQDVVLPGGAGLALVQPVGGRLQAAPAAITAPRTLDAVLGEIRALLGEAR